MRCVERAIFVVGRAGATVQKVTGRGRDEIRRKPSGRFFFIKRVPVLSAENKSKTKTPRNITHAKRCERGERGHVDIATLNGGKMIFVRQDEYEWRPERPVVWVIISRTAE